MSTASVNGISIYYEKHGAGAPLLWIGGLGANIREIPHLIDAYSPHFTFIAFDARGCGQSDQPDGDCTIAGLAEDAAGLLDALRVESTLVYGSSMGGMVAQELVLRHPSRVRALVLGCTTAGPMRGVRPSQATVEAMIRNQSLSGDEALEAGWALGYSQGFIEKSRSLLLARSRHSSEFAAPRESYMRQVLAAAQHDTYDRLQEIRCPVLIIHGSEDLMMPVGNAHLLKERIPHAELAILEGLGHGYNLEGNALADPIVIDFLKRQAAAPDGRVAHAAG